MHDKLIRSKVYPSVGHYKNTEEISGYINGENFTNHLSYYRFSTTALSLLSFKLTSVKMIMFPRW
jgi:hypothetical protein